MFFTATILEWKRLLKPSKYKDFIIESVAIMIRAKKRLLVITPKKGEKLNSCK